MSWVRLDDQWHEHPKFTGLGDLGELMWVKALTYACRFRTGGFIPAGRIAKFTALRNTAQLEAKLVKAGLWIKVEDGYQIHDFDAYQPNADKTSQARSLAGSKGAAKRWQGDGNCHDVANGKQVAKDSSYAGTRAHLPSPSPSPIPNPTEPRAEAGPASAGTARLAVVGDGMSPEAREIAAAIRAKPSLQPVHGDAGGIGDTHVGFMMRKPEFTVAWAVESIDTYAAKVVDGTLATPMKSGLVGFLRTPPKAAPASGIRKTAVPVQPSATEGEYDWKHPERWQENT